jgi:phosphoglucosamine mutase
LTSLVSSLEGRDLKGQRIVIDCANGAASQIAPKVFLALKADLIVINAEPNGRNINAGCGSNQPRMLQEKVLATKADLGLALDGDADRLIAVSSDGAVVDGDQMLCLFATDFASRDLLQSQAVVVTVMSNMGLLRAMAQNNIRVEQTLVGDRNVLAAMNEQGIELGGEQSGHIIFGKHSTTGDGILSGVLLADLMKRRGGDTVAIAASAMKQHPQVLINVAVAGTRIDVEKVFAQEIVNATSKLNDTGRVLVRASGTEPIVRVMVEAETKETATSVAAALAHEIETHVIGPPPKSEY